MIAQAKNPTSFDPEAASTVDHAFYYRDAFGMQAVPAMVPGCTRPWKRPSIGSWTNYTHRLVSHDTCTEWFPPGFKKNIGIITGVGGIWVLDIDSHKHPEAERWLQELLNIHNNGLQLETATQRTGGGGLQFVFKAPASWTPPTFRTDMGVDIRGVGGFAVMPPSIHETGNHYVWLLGKEPWNVGVMVAPSWLTDAVDRLPRGSTRSAGQVDRTQTPEYATNSLGLLVDGREDYMTKLIWAKVVDMYRVGAWGMQSDEPPPPNDPRENMHETFQQYLQKVDTRINEPGTGKDLLLEREDRGVSLFTQKWNRAIAQWGGKVKQAALDVQGNAISTPRSIEELLVEVQGVDTDDADAIGVLVNEAARLDPVRRERVLAAIKKQTGLGMGALRESIRESSCHAPPDQLGLARMVIDEIGRENILVSDGLLWQWSPSGVWRKIEERTVKQKLQHCAEGKKEDVTAAYVNGALDLLKNEIMLRDHHFNLGSPETVNCLNGELQLENADWRLVTHRRELFRTTQIPVAYDPSAKAPSFSLFLQQIFRDDFDKDDKIRALLEMIGYTLMSHARHEKFVMLIGPGANGKSVLLAVLEALCGPDNVAGVQPGSFNRAFQRAHLHQKLANIITELKQGEIIADAELKAITSGEPSTVEHKFRDPFVMRPFSTCWFGTNHMPHTRDFSDALFRRALILTFNRTFSETEQDKDLKDKLKEELPGILNMALNAYAYALIVGFIEPVSSRVAKEEWRLEADQVAQFVDECCQRQATGKETIADVFRIYGNWAQSQGITKTMAKKGLRERLTRLGFGDRRTSSDRYVVGLVLSQQSRSELGL